MGSTLLEKEGEDIVSTSMGNLESQVMLRVKRNDLH